MEFQTPNTLAAHIANYLAERIMTGHPAALCRRPSAEHAPLSIGRLADGCLA
jgi:hypothetical protein